MGVHIVVTLQALNPRPGRHELHSTTFCSIDFVGLKISILT